MEFTADLWMGIWLGLLFFGPSEIQGDFLNISSLSGHNYFSEGSGLVSNFASVSKRTVTARKKAPDSVSLSVNVTQEARESIDPILRQSQISVPPSLQGNSSNGAHYVLQHTSTPRTIERQVSTASSSDPHESSSALFKIATAKNDTAVTPLNVATTPFPKKKSKPGITYDVEDVTKDENGKAIVTKENLVSADPSFDYVVPIVIAMLTIPFVVVLLAFLYKKSRDFWDRRHYRRMDFLIDGMYND